MVIFKQFPLIILNMITSKANMRQKLTFSKHSQGIPWRLWREQTSRYPGLSWRPGLSRQIGLSRYKVWPDLCWSTHLPPGHSNNSNYKYLDENNLFNITKFVQHMKKNDLTHFIYFWFIYAFQLLIV